MGIIDGLFFRHQIIKLKLIKEAIENPNKRLPTAKELARKNGVSELTIKKVEKELVHRGYIVSNKKGGTRTMGKFAKEQISSFIASRESFRALTDTLLKHGFTPEDIVALVYDVLSNIKNNQSLVIYSEKDDRIAIFAKKELEHKTGSNVIFKPFDTLRTELMNNVISNKVIVVPFYCYSQIESYKNGLKVVPIKTVHPLEFISPAHDIPYSSRIFYIAASKLDKENALSIYYDVLSKRYRVYIYTQDELFANKHLLNYADIVVAFSWILESEKDFMKGAKSVVKVDRIDDDEGVRMVKAYINELMGES